MEKTVDLDLETILRECSLNPVLARDHFYYFSLENRENIHQAFKYKKFNEDFTSTLSCYNDGSNIIGYIRPSYDEFLNKLINILNVKVDKVEDNDDLTKTLLARLGVLRSIKTERELLIEFPILYNDLISGRKYYNGLKQLRKSSKNGEEQYQSGEHYYYGCALKKSLPNFIKTQSEMYRRYIVDRHKLKNIQESKTYNNYIKKNFNLPKLYLYIIHEYLNKCESGTLSARKIEMYLNLIKQYLDSNIEKNVHIVLKNGQEINLSNIKNRYFNLKRSQEDKSKVVEWVIIPSSKKKESIYKKGQSRKISMSEQEADSLRKLGEEKKDFYDKSGYIAKAIGLKRYHGYVAYIYENGQVILDREYNSMYPRTAKGNAIYNLQAVDFEELSKKNKSILMKHPKVGRIIHSKNWEDRVLEIIKKEATREEELSAKVLIKKLQKKD